MASDFDRGIVPRSMNPDLTPELSREVSFFTKWGYLIVNDAVSMDQIEALKVALDHAYQRKEEMFIHELLEEDDAFIFLLDNPPVLERMKAILGNCIQLHSATARVTEPGEKDQDWHRDGP